MDKRLAYDWDTRVPLVIKGPGVGRGTTVGALVTNVDLAPTVMAPRGSQPCGGHGAFCSTADWISTYPPGAEGWRDVLCSKVMSSKVWPRSPRASRSTSWRGTHASRGAAAEPPRGR